MAKAPKKSKAKAPKRERIEKAELFAAAYIKHMGNGTRAALEVFDTKDEASAQRMGSEYLGKPVVREIVGRFLDARRASLKRIIDQTEFYMTEIAVFYMEIMQNREASLVDRFRAADKLSRFAGVDMNDDVAVSKIQSKFAARGHAVLPGVAAPGIQPGQPGGHVDNSSKTIFMLMPPPMPPGGVPPPALLEQWKQQGWQPGVAVPPPVEKNAGHANTPPFHSTVRK